jgi:hypothetical protein
MTEIQWLCDVLLNFKLPSPVKDRFIARIGEVEAGLSRPTIMAPQITMQNRPIIPQMQAASTQKILDEIEMGPMNPMLTAKHVPEKIDKETGRPMVSTGKGTAGPRKF